MAGTTAESIQRCIHSMDRALAALDKERIEIIAARRELRERLDDLTPVRRESAAEIRAAFQRVGDLTDAAADALKGKP